MPTRSPPTLLLIEPDERQRNALRAALRDAGFDVYSTADAESGFSMLLSLKQCACIVMNGEQTGLSAADFVERSRSYVRFHRIPLVVLGEPARASGPGVHATLPRPYQPRDVVHVITRCVQPAPARDVMRDAE